MEQNYIIVQGKDKKVVKVQVRCGQINEYTLRRAFQLDKELPVSLWKDDLFLGVRPEGVGNEGYEVTVVNIEEHLGLIVLRSEKAIGPKSPRLVPAEKSESFLLAGFGDMNTGTQQLVYSTGIVHSVGHHFCRSGKSMGPLVLGTLPGSRRDSGGACWSAKGLIGIICGVITVPETTYTHAISEEAIYSPTNYISPATKIRLSIVRELGNEKCASIKASVEKKGETTTCLVSFNCLLMAQNIFVPSSPPPMAQSIDKWMYYAFHFGSIFPRNCTEFTRSFRRRLLERQWTYWHKFPKNYMIPATLIQECLEDQLKKEEEEEIRKKEEGSLERKADSPDVFCLAQRKKKLGESGNEEEMGEKRGGEKEVGDLKKKEGPTCLALVAYLKFYVALTIFVSGCRSESIVCRCCCSPLIAVPGLVFLFERIGSAKSFCAIQGDRTWSAQTYPGDGRYCFDPSVAPLSSKKRKAITELSHTHLKTVPMGPGPSQAENESVGPPMSNNQVNIGSEKKSRRYSTSKKELDNVLSNRSKDKSETIARVRQLQGNATAKSTSTPILLESTTDASKSEQTFVFVQGKRIIYANGFSDGPPTLQPEIIFSNSSKHAQQLDQRPILLLDRRPINR
ncbi:unnamed protein product, partial [Mesorhabditis belari]|uniref:Uncharacterized protein n=1 Tax=Mesorhabditis belari TaxID=2138241 RepID=A0AAF3F466_9BILA